jgi:MFS family permease
MLPTIVAAFVVLCEGIVLWSVFPVLPLYNDTLGGADWFVGLLFASMTFPKIFVNPIYGRVSDRIGRKPILIFAGLGSMAASITWALSGNLTILLISRLLSGTFAGQAVLAQTVMADVTPAHRRTQGMAILGMAFGSSMVVGPLFASAVGLGVSFLGFGAIDSLAHFSAIGWSSAAVSLAGLLAVVFLLPETRPAQSSESASTTTQPVVPYRGVLREPTVFVLLMVSFLATYAAMQFTTTFALFAKSRYGLTSVEISMAFTLFGLVAVLVQGGIVRMLAPRIGSRKVTTAGLLLMAVGLVVSGLEPSLYTLFGAISLLAAGVAFQTPAVAALISRAVPADRQGAVLGHQQSVMSLARVVGAAPAAKILASAGSLTLYGGAAAVAVVGAVLVLRKVPTTLDEHEPQPEPRDMVADFQTPGVPPEPSRSSP